MNISGSTKRVIDSYKPGQLEFKELSQLCLKGNAKIAVMSSNDASTLEETEFLFLECAASSPLLLPAKLFAFKTALSTIDVARHLTYEI